ncbi:hypothetical protein F4859DRAFT_87364 [Xylaria cf. heliscus]|nr:hypothetical protein F4859DRAFT_87364 [Xylaria cf. heliscus]
MLGIPFQTSISVSLLLSPPMISSSMTNLGYYQRRPDIFSREIGTYNLKVLTRYITLYETTSLKFFCKSRIASRLLAFLLTHTTFMSGCLSWRL